MNKNVQACSSGPLGQILLEGIEEIIGLAGMNAVVDQARLGRWFASRHDQEEAGLGDFEEIQAALESLYGVRGGQGIALRAGRASFYRILRDHGDEMGLNAPNFRFRSTTDKFSLGLHALAQRVGELCAEDIEVLEDENAWAWQSASQCPSSPASLIHTCNHFVMGILQEFTLWAAGGRHFLLDRTECDAPAGGATGQIRILKQAID